MPYYHIKIKRKKGRPSTLYLFDLTKDSLEFFLKQARRGVTADVPQADEISWVETKYINEIKIVKTSRKSSFYGIGYIKGENVFDKGKDVTEQFVEKPKTKTKASLSPEKLSKRVFIVHGTNHKPMRELKVMLKEFGLNPIVLHEQPSGSRTIVEKLEKYSDVGYAFVILTPDDVGALHSKFAKFRPELLFKRSLRSVLDLKPRARQNVVLEFGFFMGLLGRDKVCCLYKGGIELPSDMRGIVYIPFKDSVKEVRDMIIKELEEAGYKIKM